ERRVMDIADHMRLRPEDDVGAVNWTLDGTVDDDGLRADRAGDPGLLRYVERRAAQIAYNRAMHRHKPFGRNVAFDLQASRDNGFIRCSVCFRVLVREHWPPSSRLVGIAPFHS